MGELIPTLTVKNVGELETANPIGASLDVSTTWLFQMELQRLPLVPSPSSKRFSRRSAFKGCSGLTSVTLPEGLATIELCALTSVTIPDGVTTIGAYAFDGCRGLMSVTIPDGVEKIGYHAFGGCEELAVVVLSVPFDGLNSNLVLGDGAFHGCRGLSFAIAPPHLRESLRRHFYDFPLLLQL
eukprot:m.49259 g.49259  ORF g.49259 m.49259 type:complete len:183 (-) comp8950_c0_seq1:432-980(-)